MSDSVQPHRRQPTRPPHSWDSPGKNTGVGCHFLLQHVKVKSLSRVQLLATSWTAAYPAPLSMGFSRQGYWSGVTLPSPIIHIVGFKSTFLLFIFYLSHFSFLIFSSLSTLFDAEHFLISFFPSTLYLWAVLLCFISLWLFLVFNM